MVHQRDSKIEFLRIIAMFLIILGHIIYYTNWHYNAMTVSHQVSIQSLWIGAKLGVNLFFLITGYFLIRQTALKSFKIAHLWITTLFYSWMILMLTLIFYPHLIKLGALIKSVFPILGGYYWFISTYIFLILLAPILNKVLATLSQKEYCILLIVGFGYLFILATFFTNKTTGSNNTLITAIYLYCCGGYIRLYRHNSHHLQAHYLIHLIILLSMLVFLIGSIYVLDLLIKNGFIKANNHRFFYFADGNSPFELIGALELFLVFLQLPSFHNRWINKIATTTLPMYLLHDNYLSHYLIINQWIHATKYQYTNKVQLYCLFWAIVLVFILAAIDLIVQFLFGKGINRLAQVSSQQMRRFVRYFYNLINKLMSS